MFKRKIVASALILGTSVVYAGAMGDAVIQSHKYYIGVEGGASISAETHFQPKYFYSPPTNSIFVSPVNTDWSRDLGSAGLGGVFIGYEWNSNVAVQFSYAYRGSYDWTINAVEDDSVFAPDVYDYYDAKNINFQTFLIDLKLKPTVNWGGFVPYVKGGIGVAVNKVGSIRNIDVPLGFQSPSFNTLLDGKSTTNFAWDAGVGADYYFNDQFDIGLGYRFVSVGTLQSGVQAQDFVLHQSTTASPFVAQNVFLHELVASVAYHFDFA